MSLKPGAIAYIVRPWLREEDIGRPVTLIRLGRIGEMINSRDGGLCECTGTWGPAWLCEANDPGFPCFIAAICLRPLGGDDIDLTTTTDEPLETKT